MTTPTTQREADERALFECAERASDLTRDEDRPEDYANPCVQSAWEGWQARAAIDQSTRQAAPIDDEPTMLWLHDDNEVFANGPDEFAEDYACNCLRPGEEAEVRVDCAYRGSTRTMHIAMVENGDDDKVVWKWSDETAATDQPSAGRVDERARKEKENGEFAEWWNREQACPEHSLITENAAHAAWQERARRASLTPTAPQAASQQGDAAEAFCDSHCVWTDHHPECKIAATQAAAPDERRNIAEVKRTSDMGLSIRFLSARACSAFERYLAAPPSGHHGEPSLHLPERRRIAALALPCTPARDNQEQQAMTPQQKLVEIRYLLAQPGTTMAPELAALLADVHLPPAELEGVTEPAHWAQQMAATVAGLTEETALAWLGGAMGAAWCAGEFSGVQRGHQAAAGSMASLADALRLVLGLLTLGQMRGPLVRDRSDADAAPRPLADVLRDVLLAAGERVE